MRRYTFKLYPSKAQAADLERLRRMHGQLYNALLQQRIEAYRRCVDPLTGKGKSLSAYDQQKECTALRRADPDWRLVNADSMGLTCDRLDLAFKAFFRRALAGAGASSGFPKFQRGEDYAGWTMRKHCSGWKVEPGADLRNGRIRCQGVAGWLRMRGAFPARPLDFRTADFMLRDGAWCVSIACRMPGRRAPGEGAARITLDLISEFARLETLADGGPAAGPMASPEAEGPNHPAVPEGCTGSPAASPQTGGEQGLLAVCRPVRKPAASPQTAGDQGLLAVCRPARKPAASPQTGGDQGTVVSIAMIAALQRRRAALRLARTGKPLSRRERALKRRIARLHGRAARRRREALHEWTTAVTRRFAAVELIAPRDIKAATRSGAGSRRDPGAEVRFKAMLNRRILSFAPAEAIAMLDYKLAESGGRFTLTETDGHPAHAGNTVVAVAKLARKAKRKIDEKTRSGSR